MNIRENNEYNFLFLMNKCVLLFNYIDIYYQKEILNDYITSINNSLNTVLSFTTQLSTIVDNFITNNNTDSSIINNELIGIENIFLNLL